MGNKTFQFWSFLIYWLKKEDIYAIHSPLLFKTYTELFYFISQHKNQNLEIEEFRKALIESKEIIEIIDLGAGSKKVNTPKRKVSDITKYSTSNRKTSQLLQFFCSLTPAQTVIELGTCVGINTRYLAQTTKGKLATFEGSNELVRIAKENLCNPRIEFLLGEISETLPIFLTQSKSIDFAFIDANHTYKATIESFKNILEKIHSNSIVIIGDIHWSHEMELAWKHIINYAEVKLSIDFFEVGVLFFDFPGEKEHYILDF